MKVNIMNIQKTSRGPEMSGEPGPHLTEYSKNFRDINTHPGYLNIQKTFMPKIKGPCGPTKVI
jgi:hypothetical protein